MREWNTPLYHRIDREWASDSMRLNRSIYGCEMLLGIFFAKGVPPLEFKRAHSVGDLLTQRLVALEQEADEKSGVQQALAEHFA